LDCGRCLLLYQCLEYRISPLPEFQRYIYPCDPGRLRADMRIVFDNTGGVYKVKKIANAASGYKLDVKKYLAYSPVSRFLFSYSISHADTRSHLGLHAHHLRTEHVRAVLCDPECSTCLGHS
jgi:hypothetical protein